MKISKSTVQSALEELRSLPNKDPQLTASEAVAELAPAVRELRARGYTPEDIAAHLKRLGIAVSAHALKRAAGTARKRAGAPKGAQKAAEVGAQGPGQEGQ